LWIWGDNQSGAAGAPGFSANISSPIQTIASGYNWTQCSASTLGVASIRDFNMYNM
jgi:hypothetical protein